MFLQENVTLERLNLAGNWMEDEGSMHMARMLHENDYITELVSNWSSTLYYNTTSVFVLFPVLNYLG